MKPSELTDKYIAEYLKIDDTEDVTPMKEAAFAFASAYTGLPQTATEEKSLDDHEDITIAILALIADMHENRIANLDKQSYANETVERILAMHSVNYI